jgi:hypothetical protein
MKTQAMGWLAAAVVAAGLNASYHQGGMQWAHRVADQIEYRTGAVIALAAGHAERFFAETQLAKAELVNEQLANEKVQALGGASSCPLERAIAQVQSRIADSQTRFERFNDRLQTVVSAREAKEQARMEDRAARMEAQRDRIEAKVSSLHIPAMTFSSVNVPMPKIDIPKIDVCPRIRVSVPQVPTIRIPQVEVPSMPEIHINIPGTDSI